MVSFAVSEYACGDADCTFPAVAYRFGEGTLTSASLDLPEPGTATLLGAGLLLAGLTGRRRQESVGLCPKPRRGSAPVRFSLK